MMTREHCQVSCKAHYDIKHTRICYSTTHNALSSLFNYNSNNNSKKNKKNKYVDTRTCQPRLYFYR
jgi:hypothetical protein